MGPGIDVVTEKASGGVIVGDLDVGFNGHNGWRAARLADGATYWNYGRRWTPLPRPLFGPVRVDERHVVAVWCDARVTSIDVPKGAIAWRIRLPRGPKGTTCFDGDETAEDGWDFRLVGDPKDPILVIQRAGRIDALDPRTGRVRWHASTEKGTPLEAFGWTVIAADKDGIAVLDARDGRRRWSLKEDLTGHLRFIVGLGQDRIAAQGDDSLVVFRAQDGRPLWQTPPAALNDLSNSEEVAVAGDLLLVRGTTSLTAYRAADGRVAWRVPIPGKGGQTVLATADGQTGYTARGESTLVQFDTRTGKIIDERDFSGPITLVSINDDLLVLYVVGHDGALLVG